MKTLVGAADPDRRALLARIATLLVAPLHWINKGKRSA
jgi:hypothetical protein